MLRASKYLLFAMGAMTVVLLSAVACGGAETVVEVTREVPVEQRVEVTRQVEVQQQVEVTREVEVEVEKTVEVVREVEREVEVEVTKVVTEQVMMEPLPPLVVGQLNAFTGSLSYFGEHHRKAADLAADHVNAAGGIQGGSVIIISRDTAVNPQQGVESARALVDVENVAAIVGALASGVTIPVATTVTVPNRILQISHSSTAPSITVLEDDDFLFRTTVSDAAQGVVLARLADEEGFETAGILYINNAYGEGLANQFTVTFEEMGGEVMASVPHEDSQPTFVSELTKATEGDPDVLVVISYPGQAEIYLREAAEGDYTDSFLLTDGVKSEDMVAALGSVLDGSVGTAPGTPSGPERDAFYSSFAESFGVEAPQEPYLAETYDAVALIALAAAQAGTTTDSPAIRDALREVANPPGEVVGPGVESLMRAMQLIAEGRDINYEGAAGPVDFDENGDVGAPIEIWAVADGAIQSTGRFELP